MSLSGWHDLGWGGLTFGLPEPAVFKELGFGIELLNKAGATTLAEVDVFLGTLSRVS